MASSPAWQLWGQQGFIGPEEQASVGDEYNQGDIGYYLRDGIHFMSRADWLAYLRFVKQHLYAQS